MRDILIHADDFTACTSSMEYGMRLAASFDARVTGVYVCPSPLTVLSPYDAPQLASAVIEQIRELEQVASVGCAPFIARATQLEVGKAFWQVAEGSLADVLAHLGNWHDLLVLGRHPHSDARTDATLGSVVLGSRMPCIVVPPEITQPRFECVALGWNHSPESLRAIHAARPVLERAQRIVVLAGEPRARFSEIGWKPEFQLSSYLAQHGFAFETRAVDAEDVRDGTVLLAAAAACEADLLVMGAYGRTRFSEWIFGGATRHVLAHARLPVLLRH